MNNFRLNFASSNSALQQSGYCGETYRQPQDNKIHESPSLRAHFFVIRLHPLHNEKTTIRITAQGGSPAFQAASKLFGSCCQ
jgi:hypothetical protein